MIQRRTSSANEIPISWLLFFVLQRSVPASAAGGFDILYSTFNPGLLA